MSVSLTKAPTVRDILTREYVGDSWQRDHVFSYYAQNYYSDYTDLIIFNDTRAEDRHGYDDAIGISNFRHLDANWGHLDAFSTGPYTNCKMVALRLDKPAPEDLMSVIHALAYYPLLDESLYSEVEQEIIEEHWESYGEYDALRDLADILTEGDTDELPNNAADMLKEVLSSGEAGYPEMIDPSAVDFHTDAVVAIVAARIRAGV